MEGLEVLVTMVANGRCNQLPPSFSGICCSSYRQPYFDLNFSRSLFNSSLIWTTEKPISTLEYRDIAVA